MFNSRKNSAIIAHNNFIQNWTNDTSVNINLFSICSKNLAKKQKAFIKKKKKQNFKITLIIVFNILTYPAH